MRILQRFVLLELLKKFTLILTALTFLLMVVGVLREASARGLGPVEILQILPYVVPSILPFTIPATLLLTVCVVYGRMAGDQEVTAIKAAGIDVREILRPAFILGAMLSLGTLLLTDRCVPWAEAQIAQIVLTSMENIFLDTLRATNQFIDPNRGIAVTARRVDGRRLIDPTFRYTLPDGKSASITAREATLTFDLPNQQVLLDLLDVHTEMPDGAQVTIKESEQRAFPFLMTSNGLVPPRNLAIESIRRELDETKIERQRATERRIIETALVLSTGRFGEFWPGRESQRLAAQVAANREERVRKLDTEVHNRIALACSCFFFVLVGSPFAIQQGKRQFLTSFAICFTPIVLLYYPAVLLSMNQAREGVIPAWWGMWIGNAGLAVAAFVILRRVRQH